VTPEMDLAGILLSSLAWVGVLSVAGALARLGMGGMVRVEQEQERKQDENV